MPTALALARGALVRLAWLLAAIVIAAGSAGLVTGIGGPTGSTVHPELTWSGDRAIQPGFDRALADLRSLSDEVDRLGLQGRAALAALAARDQAKLNGTIVDGSTLVDAIESDALAIRERLRALPGVNGAAPPLPASAQLALGPEVRSRYEALDAALGTTTGLSDEWVRLTAGSLAAIQLSTLLADHDASTAAAARQGRGGHYAAALKQLTTSTSLIDRASKQRDTLQNTVDVTTLSRWLELNASYDTTLRKLYDALRRSKGRVNAEVRAAFAAEAKAHDELPPDTRGLVVIMGEIARGGLNQAVIGIEEARGDLAAAIDVLSGAPGATEPIASPEPTTTVPAASPSIDASSPSPSGSASRTFPAVVTPAPSG